MVDGAGRVGGIARVIPSIAEVAAADWDRCANPHGRPFDPFVSHAFLAALEESGSVGGRSGWSPCHLVLEDGAGGITGVLPLYLKTHSQGEYVFDHGWAEAYMRAGGAYYPKLQAAVPFTPVPGRRLLMRAGSTDADANLLASAALAYAESLGVSSLHVTFLSEAEAGALARRGFLIRTGQQFHWSNAGYRTFDDFLATLASRKRKAIRREREAVRDAGLTIERLTGSAITEADWDAFFAFYIDTGNRKWGRPYLNRAFFSLLAARMADRVLMVMVKRGDQRVGGALNLIGGDCLYGRYWGAIEHHPCLHFEACYYQAIEHAIERGLPRVEAGAQGEHKLARGYLPVITYSAHWIADPALRDAVVRFLAGERRAVAAMADDYAALGPYRRGPDPEA